jgi:adenosylcobinamide-phosphate synthase
METRLRKRGGNLRRSAFALTGSTVIVTMVITALVLWLLGLWGRIPTIIGSSLICWMGLSMRCLAKEASDVGKALRRGLADGRKQVSRIVGRDTQSLSQTDVVRAAIETVAENTTDGVIAPMIWYMIGGPIAMMGFKAASTLDSMVGYMSDKYRDIGWTSAKLDDLLNYLPARLCAVLMCLAAFILRLDGYNAMRIVKRDHANHKSPNCAWSEAAAAGALRIQLGGTHDYSGKPVVKPAIGDDERAADVGDIRRVNGLMYVACGIWLAVLAGVGMLAG